MKKRLLFLVAMVVLFFSVQSQNVYHPWIMGVSTNFVDFHAIDQPFGDQLSDAKWMGKEMPSMLRIGRLINSSFTFSGILSTVVLEPSSLNDIPLQLPVTSSFFWKLGGQIEYKFANGYLLPVKCIFDPYVFLGLNGSTINELTYMSQSTGIGINIWPTEQFGVNFQGSYDYMFDFNDYYNFSFGLVVRLGHMADKDNDRIPNIYDLCPEVPGIEKFEGCPDTDGDGVEDSKDKCPKEYGMAEADGCPDFDRDGVVDGKDLCPCEAGPAELNGCPDTDGDGVLDKDDKCPTQKGPKETEGCPDQDGDGVPDAWDLCPTEPGPKENGGCPEKVAAVVTAPVVLEKVLEAHWKNIQFKTGSANLTDESKVSLNNIYRAMVEYPNSKFTINGYTDDTGPDEVNAQLSKERAEKVKKYFIDKGINPNRLKATGYGEQNPVVPNTTWENRAQNRRVEIKITK
nr:OmpA family protein [Bacteroidota bacterium]